MSRADMEAGACAAIEAVKELLKDHWDDPVGMPLLEELSALNPAAIVAGVKGEDVSDSLDWNRLRTGDIRALNPAHQDVFDEVASLRARVAELERDADRLAALVWPECVLDGIGAIDIHEEAVIYASAFGREEPNKDDYLAALRTAIDAAMMEKE